jgi:hypothetical protein
MVTGQGRMRRSAAPAARLLITSCGRRHPAARQARQDEGTAGQRKALAAELGAARKPSRAFNTHRPP